MSVLIAYGTIEGQTGKIARFVEKLVNDRGEEVHLLDTSERAENVDMKDFSKAILAGSVHERRHPVEYEVFLTANRKALNKKPTLLLSVSLNAAFDEGAEEAQDYVDEMKMRTEIEPDIEMLVPGAVRTSSYDYYETQILRHVILKDRDFDPASREHEFTDWDSLADGVNAFLDGAD